MQHGPVKLDKEGKIRTQYEKGRAFLSIFDLWVSLCSTRHVDTHSTCHGTRASSECLSFFSVGYDNLSGTLYYYNFIASSTKTATDTDLTWVLHCDM